MRFWTMTLTFCARCFVGLPPLKPVLDWNDLDGDTFCLSSKKLPVLAVRELIAYEVRAPCFWNSSKLSASPPCNISTWNSVSISVLFRRFVFSIVPAGELLKLFWAVLEAFCLVFLVLSASSCMLTKIGIGTGSVFVHFRVWGSA